jgi:hypothetical protein
MQFTVGTVTRCAGQRHYKFPLTFGSGKQETLECTLDELEGEPVESKSEARTEILDRLRSAIKEANAATFNQLRTAVETRTFKI